ncbi:MAG TPA: hypothetical protein PKC28_13410, partial [Bdellovibrionales bacterium]|nr:hypothetical protein [Bdellovibrionales bacterium]
LMSMLPMVMQMMQGQQGEDVQEMPMDLMDCAQNPNLAGCSQAAADSGAWNSSGSGSGVDTPERATGEFDLPTAEGPLPEDFSAQNNGQFGD